MFAKTIDIYECYMISFVHEGGMVMAKGIVSAKALASYIIDFYKKKFSEEISPIKLQKALYFCFAYWGGHVRKSKLPDTEITIDKSEWLFDEDIEAWVYGPVVPDVYHCIKLDSFRNENLFSNNLDVKDFIDGVLDEILGVSDFKLVEVSHLDNCWKKNFSSSSSRHNKVIDKEDIIDEYAKIY